MKIKVKSSISAAHFVHKTPESKCFSIHGHNWKIKVNIKGKAVDNGMVIDKSDIDNYLDEFDHKILIPKNLVEEVDETHVILNKKGKESELPIEDTVIFDDIDVITSERLAEKFTRDIFSMTEDCSFVRVEVQESEKLSAQSTKINEVEFRGEI